MNRVEQINEILHLLKAGTPDVEGCAVVSGDGLMIASVFPESIDEGRVAGMTSSLLSLGARTALELGRGNLKQVFVKGDLGYVIAQQASDGVVLVVLTSERAKLGIVFLDMRRAVEKISKVL